ncbi:MAG: SRPBCC family protein [Nostoc sp. CmiSLP01]|nr:SRPBCC domain-containing protein [Nostoc sp. CmiSLP01]MDZ8286529.1 SRPBCC domain-containing protein [Nostoc sp. ChiSLP01]
MQIHTDIEIQAPVEEVWQQLTDLANYPKWNPFILRATGNVETGARLNVFIQPPGSQGMTFKPIVLRAEQNKEFRWLGKFLLPKLLDAEHVFYLEQTGTNSAHLYHSEFFSGLLVPLFKRSLEGNSRAGFEAMNQALKTRAERTSKL